MRGERSLGSPRRRSRLGRYTWTDADGLGCVYLDLRDAAGVNDIFTGTDAVVHFGSPPADAWLSATEAYHQVASAGFNVFQADRAAAAEWEADTASADTPGSSAAGEEERDEFGVVPDERRDGPEEEESRLRGRGETAHHLVAQIRNPHSASTRAIFTLHISSYT